MEKADMLNMKMAIKLSVSGRYFYVNPSGVKHACNIRKDDRGVIIVFGRDEEIPLEFLQGNFYYRH